jgi:hypothetical protein
LRGMYDSVKTQEKPYLACKNHHLAAILRHEEIPFVNLCTGKAPPSMQQLDLLYEGYWLCPFHTEPWLRDGRKPHTCSERKTKYLLNWINDEIGTEPPTPTETTGEDCTSDFTWTRYQDAIDAQLEFMDISSVPRDQHSGYCTCSRCNTPDHNNWEF